MELALRRRSPPGWGGVHSSLDADSFPGKDPPRFSRTPVPSCFSPAHRTPSAPADVRKRSAVAEPAPTRPLKSSHFLNPATGFSPPSCARGRLGRRPPQAAAASNRLCYPWRGAGWEEGPLRWLGAGARPLPAARRPVLWCPAKESSQLAIVLFPGRGGRLGFSPRSLP